MKYSRNGMPLSPREFSKCAVCRDPGHIFTTISDSHNRGNHDFRFPAQFYLLYWCASCLYLHLSRLTYLARNLVCVRIRRCHHRLTVTQLSTDVLPRYAFVASRSQRLNVNTVLGASATGSGVRSVSREVRYSILIVLECCHSLSVAHWDQS